MRKIRILITGFVLTFVISASFVLPLYAEDFYCEVMSVEGTVTLSNSTVSGKPIQEGDLLKVDDLVEVSSSSSVDLAYDSQWNNITRVEENSRVRLRSIYPTEIDLEVGGIFAKLKSLPRDSSFDVKTPTAIASVRGTEYRTTFLSGETQIYNVSDSDVYVFGLDEEGNKQAEPMVLGRSQVTQVQKRGAPPIAARPMEEKDFQPVKRFQEGIDRKVHENVSKGRFGKIQDIKTIERIHEERRAMGGGESRQTDQLDKPRTLTSDDASDAARALRGEGLGQSSGPEGSQNNPDGSGAPREDNTGALRSDEFGKRSAREEKAEPREIDSYGDDSPSRKGLAEPFFPGNEKRRGGGPEPVNFPDDRWKSGGENNGQRHEGEGFERQRHAPASGQQKGPGENVGQGEKKEPAQPKNQNQGKPRPGPQKHS